MRMEAESAFPGLFSEFEAERFTSGVELPQSQNHKFEDLEFGEGDEFGALSDVVHQHQTLNVIIDKSGGSMKYNIVTAYSK